MIICSTCAKENEDFFKFCLGCGADLIGAPKLDEGATIESESTDEPMTRRAGSSGEAARGDDESKCRICGASQDPAFAFCADCGASFAELNKTGPVAAVSPEPPRSGIIRGKLVLVREDGTDGETFPLDADGAVIGRDAGHITFPADDFLASEHVELVYDGDELVARPLPSTNGVFVRVFDEIYLVSGAHIRIGQELLAFDVAEGLEGQPEPARDGTLPLGSPVGKDVWGRLVQLMGPETYGESFMLRGEDVFIGRERGEIRFPDDGYVSGSHAVLSRRDGQLTLRDLGSSNGTFVRMAAARVLRTGDFILVGQQLLRVEP